MIFCENIGLDEEILWTYCIEWRKIKMNTAKGREKPSSSSSSTLLMQWPYTRLIFVLRTLTILRFNIYAINPSRYYFYALGKEREREIERERE